MTEEEQRAAVVAEALSWLGTPHHHRGRIKGVGVDCAQLPIAVYASVGLFEAPTLAYVHDWHLHRSREIYIEEIEALGGVEIPVADRRAGDLMVWKWGRTYSHGGILVDEARVVHSYLDAGVSLDEIDGHEELRTRERRCFSMWPT